MSTRCERCGEPIDEGGLLAAIGLAESNGYRCTQCGYLLCEQCQQERRRRVDAMTPSRYCPEHHCDGRVANQ